MKTSAIRAIAHALPPDILSYEELAGRFGAEKVATIFKMSGIRHRRVVAQGQTASDLAYAAARRLMAHRNIDPLSIDLLTFASQTPDYRIPATASVLQGRLGIGEECCVFDISQGCASFMHSLAVAHSMLVAGSTRRALVLNGDAVSTLLNPRDRGLVTLHGDGAAATLLEPADSADGGIESIQLGNDGTNYDKIIVPAGGARLPANAETKLEVTDAGGCVRNQEQLVMDGPVVFHFSLYKVTDFLKSFLARRSLTIDLIDRVLLHQANKTMMDLIYKSLGVPADKRFYYLEDVGNSGGASLPSVLAQAWREGIIKPGSRTLMCSFGNGLSWGAAVVRWPADADAAVPGELIVPGPDARST